MTTTRFSTLAAPLVLCLAFAGLGAQDPALSPRFRSLVGFTEWDTVAANPAAAPRTTAMTPAEIAERFVAIFNDDDPAIADAIFAPEFIARVSGAPTSTLDRDGWKAYLASIRTTFPDLRLEVQDIVATDDTVIVRVVLRGTQTGAFGDMPPSGKEVAFDGIAMHRIENGRVVEHWGVMDLLSLVQQLGQP